MVDNSKSGGPLNPPDSVFLYPLRRVGLVTVVFETTRPETLVFSAIWAISLISFFVRSGAIFKSIGGVNIWPSFLKRLSSIDLSNFSNFSEDCRSLSPGVFGEEILIVI